MILETMTAAEIAREMETDMPHIARKMEHISHAVRRNMLKSKRFPHIECVDYRSPSKNEWFIVVTYQTKRDMLYCPINVHRTRKGTRFAMRDQVKGTISFYNAHMINRYAEREKLSTGSTIETAKAFFSRHNAIPVHKTDTLPDGTMTVVAPTSRGAMYGVETREGFVIMNTYISDAAMCDGKKEAADEYRRELEPMLSRWEAAKGTPREYANKP